jgi:ribosomal protein S27AE
VTVDGQILNFLTNQASGYDDDCLSRKLKVEPRQKVNQSCRRLEARGLVERRRGFCPACGREKILNFHREADQPTTSRTEIGTGSLGVSSASALELRARLTQKLALKEKVKALNREIHELSTLLAVEYLRSIHPEIIEWKGSPGAETGPDIVGLVDGKVVVVAEVKGTDPYHIDRLGAAQVTSIEWDIRKLNSSTASEKYLFLIGERAVSAVRHQFHNKLESIRLQDLLA